MSLRIFFKNQGEPSAFLTNDRIFLGEGLVETIRVVKGKPCFSELHWQRLQQAASLLGITFELSLSSWQNNLHQCINLGQVDQGGVKVLLGAGEASRGLANRGCNPCLVFEAFEYPIGNSAIKLISAPWRRDSNNPVYRLKSVNYLEAIMAYRYAQNRNADDALFLNENNCVTETTIANIFIILQEKLVTPSLDCGVLEGITRTRILAQCKKLSISFSEMAISMALIAKADAVFVSNSLQGIRYVLAVDEFTFQKENPIVTILKNTLLPDFQ